jgi:glycine dehydrogenase
MNYKKFSFRHIGPQSNDMNKMLEVIGLKNIDELIDKTIPSDIRLDKFIDLPEAVTENEYLKYIKAIASQNKIFKSFIGQGYYETIMPSVIQRNIFENPSWYTSYTPYQAEISQGRLEALLNFQTIITELTSLEIANASLLDEGTAGAEAMIMFYNCRTKEQIANNAKTLFIDNKVFEHTKDVIKGRAKWLNINIIEGDYKNISFTDDIFGCIVQYPNSDGQIENYTNFIKTAKSENIMVAIAADILSLVILTPPGKMGADVAFGSTQRFGIPMGFGGPYAAYFATTEKYKRNIPGRIIGVTIDTYGKPALRLALQTREQHIKREKATSNICTAQALLATMASMYVVFHGPHGLKNIATDIHNKTLFIDKALNKMGFLQQNTQYFDTLLIKTKNKTETEKIKNLCENAEINLGYKSETEIIINIGEGITDNDILKIVNIFAQVANYNQITKIETYNEIKINKENCRSDEFLKQRVFNKYHSETAIMRYIKKLERRDFSLTHSMISLGSCTMKLNPATTMLPLSWPEFNSIHPFAPRWQAKGYEKIIKELGDALKAITGFDDYTFMPNSGAAGEYTGLAIIRKYFESINQNQRNIVLIPSSAHGTNPASASMAGLKVVVVNCDIKGNIDIDDLRAKAYEHIDNLACLMVTYPSTHGVFETKIKEITEIIHKCGGQVYMDGANMNAQVGLTSPASIGADVCHINLHKTFAIPHGGGGPGAGPVLVKKHLAPFLPSHNLLQNEQGIKAVSSAPYGSALILIISHAYIKMMGSQGLTDATKYAIVNANYIAKSLEKYYPIVYKGHNGYIAHEMILDCRQFKSKADITETDIAKRLMDYGFHAPTLSFPVHGTLMVEPTESEPLEELDRFIEAMINIFNEIEEIANGKADKSDNVLKNAPHTTDDIASDKWEHPYSRQKAAFPLEWIKENKFWPFVNRVNDAYGDRNLICNCSPLNNKHI